jgi:hypothetical protein
MSASAATPRPLVSVTQAITDTLHCGSRTPKHHRLLHPWVDIQRLFHFTRLTIHTTANDQIIFASGDIGDIDVSGRIDGRHVLDVQTASR